MQLIRLGKEVVRRGSVSITRSICMQMVTWYFPFGIYYTNIPKYFYIYITKSSGAIERIQIHKSNHRQSLYILKIVLIASSWLLCNHKICAKPNRWHIPDDSFRVSQ